MANFDSSFEKFYVPGHSPRDARIALQFISERVGRQGRDMVTDIAHFGERRMREIAPKGPTGNLRRAIQADTIATPLKDVGGTGQFQAGGGWEARVSVKGPPDVYLYDARPNAVSFGENLPTGGRLVDVREYALAVNDGRRALSMPQDARPGNATKRKFFRWVSGDGHVHLRKRLAERPGVFFIERTNEEVELEAARRTRNFRLR